ncbi:GNAT family N-acetyltransferase [Oceanirhabdus seepicola]|uniref:GNAT family N-acetyltransferase n=1 Tax=Oceanirhabdus seepicola TaxID=2828781 RepID=A0A9J6P2U4_9CLOT|nr:GNAT family N-acetyltransferase [Oceanirhabdus seepicola]MCM1990510.1 GNAT family N-acetyltransferase [Oceanirhabdus seepicola]
MQLKIITDFNELQSYSDDWEELVSNIESSEIFYTWDWTKVFLQHMIEEKAKLFVVMVFERKKVIGLAPLLIKERKIGFIKAKVLEPIVSKTADYCDFYFHKNYNHYQLLKKIFGEIYSNKDKWDFMELKNFNTRSNIVNLINEVITKSFKGTCYSEQSVITPYLLYEQIESKMNKKQIKDIERRERNLRKEKKIEVCINEKMNKNVWEKFINLHKKKWKQSIFHNAKYIKFYETLIPILYEKQLLDFSYLKIDEDVAAIHFGFKTQNKNYYYIPIYDPKYANTGAGYILLKYLIENYKDNKSEFDFLRGNEKYKFDWTDSVHMNYNFYIINNNSKTWYFNRYIKLKMWAKGNSHIRKLLRK